LEPLPQAKAVIIFSTMPRDQGETIARTLVEEHLAACVNVLETRSVFRWKGKLEREAEDLLVIKTASVRTEELMRRIRELHPYELPEMIVIPLVGGHEPYIDWILQETAV